MFLKKLFIKKLAIATFIGIFILIANTFDIDEDTKDIVIGWWLIPIVIIAHK